MASELERALENFHEKRQCEKAVHDVVKDLTEIRDKVASNPDIDIQKLDSALLGYCQNTPNVSGGAAFWEAKRMSSDIWFALGIAKRRNAESLKEQGKLEEAESVFKRPYSSATPDFEQAFYKASYPSAIPSQYISWSQRNQREGEIRDEEAKCQVVRNDIKFEIVKRQASYGQTKSVLAGLEALGLSYAQKAATDRAFDTMREDCNRLVKQQEAQAVAAEKARKAAEDTEKRRYRKSLMLQIVATIAVFVSYFLWGPEPVPGANLGMTILLAGLPVLIVAILMGIYLALNYRHSESRVVIVAASVYTVLMAIMMANSFWETIGYIIMLGMVNFAFMLPLFLLVVCKYGKKYTELCRLVSLLSFLPYIFCTSLS